MRNKQIARVEWTLLATITKSSLQFLLPFQVLSIILATPERYCCQNHRLSNQQWAELSLTSASIYIYVLIYLNKSGANNTSSIFVIFECPSKWLSDNCKINETSMWMYSYIYIHGLLWNTLPNSLTAICHESTLHGPKALKISTIKTESNRHSRP